LSIQFDDFKSVVSALADLVDAERANVVQTTPAVRAREWYREFREIVLMCLVYNIKQYITR